MSFLESLVLLILALGFALAAAAPVLAYPIAWVDEAAISAMEGVYGQATLPHWKGATSNETSLRA